MGEGAIRQVRRLRRLVDPSFYATLGPRIRRALDRRFTPIYVCGVAGSGNTLLAGLLHQRYATCAFLPESALAMPPGAPLRIEKVSSYGSLPEFREALELPEDSSVEQIRRCSIRLYRAEAEYPKASELVVDKGPNVHLVRAAWLKRAFPAAKLVLIHRDPVVNVEGLRRKWADVLGAADLRDVCAFWRELHERFVADTRPFAGDVHVLSYSDLVEDPEGRLDEVARFCGLAARVDRHGLKDRPNEPGKGLRNVVGGEIRIVPDVDRQARERLDPEDLRFIEAELGEFAAGLADG